MYCYTVFTIRSTAAVAKRKNAHKLDSVGDPCFESGVRGVGSGDGSKDMKQLDHCGTVEIVIMHIVRSLKISMRFRHYAEREL
jgi:hypothetical protein